MSAVDKMLVAVDNLKRYPAVSVKINAGFHHLPELAQSEIQRLMQSRLDDDGAARILTIFEEQEGCRTSIPGS